MKAASPLCNRRTGTGPVLCGVHSPLCWRCLSASVAIGVMATLDAAGWTDPPGIGVGILLVILGALDGVRSYCARQGTTNANRVAFGLFLGMGIWTVFQAIPVP